MPRLFVVLLAALAIPATAAAHNDKLPNGLYKHALEDGSVLFTHGADPKPLHGEAMEAGDPELSPVCATTNAQQVLYAYTKASKNQLASKLESIRAQIRRNTHVLDESARASGGVGARYKVICSGGAISVAAFQTNGTGFSQIVNSAKKARHNRTDVDYTIFTEAVHETACGIGSFYSDERPGAENYNNRGGAYGVTYAGCWYGRTSMHENGHNMGAVQASAPFSTGTGAHCADVLDVMCYSPDGGDLNQSGTIARCTVMWFDCMNDTYFNAGGPILSTTGASIWNLGSDANAYILKTP